MTAFGRKPMYAKSFWESWLIILMRKFINISKQENSELARNFSYLLKYSDDYTPEDCKWIAITIFDRWLHETGSLDIIENANKEQKTEWDSQIDEFLIKLTELETPTYYKEKGRHTKRELQFRNYCGQKPVSKFLCEQFRNTYLPNVVFKSLEINLYFQDDWTLYIIYQDIEKLDAIIEIIEKNNLFLLPVKSVGKLCQYNKIVEKLDSMGLKKLSQISQ